MIEGVDLAVITTLLGKIGWDEWGKRKSSNGDGAIVQRLTAVETRLEALEEKIDADIEQRQQLAAAIREEIRSERATGDTIHASLHARVTANATAIARIQGAANGKRHT